MRFIETKPIKSAAFEDLREAARANSEKSLLNP